MESCNHCYMSSLTWCSDIFNPYCHTYYLDGYDLFCGCETGVALLLDHSNDVRGGE